MSLQLKLLADNFKTKATGCLQGMTLTFDLKLFMPYLVGHS
jgi:hypothetical protein